MSAATATTHTVPAGLITHCTALVRGHHNADITCYHAGCTDARITLVWGGVMVTLYNADAAHGLLEAFVTARAATARLPRLLPPPVGRDESPSARTTVSIEFTRRPTYAVVQQNARLTCHLCRELTHLRAHQFRGSKTALPAHR